MLLELVTEQSFEFSMLIQDSVDKFGSCLISTLINKSTHKSNNVICVYTEPSFVSPPAYDTGNICVLNVFDDYDMLPDRILKNVSANRSIVVLPSLSLFLMNYGVSKFSQLLRAMKDSNHISGVVALIHTDVLVSEETLQQIQYMFDVVVNMCPVREAELVSSYYGRARCVRRKGSGKIDSSDEYFTLDNNLSLDQVHASSSAAIKSLVIEESPVDITSNLTFNLSLNAQEREARSKLQLPYLKKDAEKVEMLSKASSSGAPLVKIGSDESAGDGGGKIYYQYDEADDFDEEDPDDDLDI